MGGTVPAGGVRLDKNNSAPRLGFTYSLADGDGFFGKLLGDNQTEICGGYVWYYGAVIADTILQQLAAPVFQGSNAFYFPDDFLFGANLCLTDLRPSAKLSAIYKNRPCVDST